MRKFVLLLAILPAVFASAQTIDKPSRVALFVTNPGLGNDGDGGVLDGGVGVAFEHRFSRKWSAAVHVAREVHDYQPRFFDPTTVEFKTYPVDVMARYSFQSVNTRWRPYMGVGVRYVSAGDAPASSGYDDEVWPELSGGVEFNAAGSWSLLLDAKGLVVNEIPDYDDLIKVSIGVGWRF